MPSLTTIKRRMIHQVVAENLAAFEGAHLESRRRGSFGAGRALAVGLPMLLTVGLWMVVSGATPGSTWRATLAGGPREVTSADSQPASAVLPAPPKDEPGQLYAAPSPLDLAVFPLQVRTVVLDPGHGGTDNPGTVGPNGLQEGDLTLDIASRLRGLLEESGYEVVMSRHDDRAVPLQERTRLANDAVGDIFVSIHVNWLEGSARGIETFFLGPTEDPELVGLTSRENRQSGYTLAALRGILEGVYTSFRRDESQKLAEAVHRDLRWHIGQVAPEVVDRGVKTAPFVVLVGTEMPAILVEVSALSHEEDARLLKLPAYRQYIALALYSGISAYSHRRHERDDQTS